MVDNKNDTTEKESNIDDTVTEADFENVAKQIKQEDTSENNEEESQEEIVNEDEVVQEEGAASKMKKMQHKAKALDTEKKQILEELQRCKADSLNAKKRYEEEKSTAVDRSQVKFIESLLPLCDSFHMAMGNTEVWQQVDEKWRKGIEGIRMQLDAVLKQYNVETQEPLGEEFDPKKHEALSEQEVDKAEDHGKILQLVQVGYLMRMGDKETLVRPARVIVGVYNGTSEAATKDTETDDTKESAVEKEGNEK